MISAINMWEQEMSKEFYVKGERSLYAMTIEVGLTTGVM